MLHKKYFKCSSHFSSDTILLYFLAHQAISGSRIDPQTLQVRKALAARLKEEVIED